MDAEQQGRRWPPCSRSLRWLTFGLSIIVLGASVFALGRSGYDGGLYVRPSIHYQVRCTVGAPVRFEPTAQVLCAVDAISHHPVCGHTSSKGALQHLLCQLSL
jgi:hypothetical protein